MLLPSSDPAESAAILQTRLRQLLKARGEAIQSELVGLNEYFIKHPYREEPVMPDNLAELAIVWLYRADWNDVIPYVHVHLGK